MKQSFAIVMALSAVLVFSSVASAGLMPAEGGDPNIPDLIYDSATGEVFLNIDASGIIGYVLKNTTSSFLPGGHTPILGGVTTSLVGELSEAALSSPGAGDISIGVVMPSGLNLAGLTSLLSTNEVSRSLGAPIVPFDLFVINDAPPIPEPATVAMAFMALAGLALYGWRRRSC